LTIAAGYALGLDNGVTETFSGTVTAPCYWVRHNTVQEGANGVWTLNELELDTPTNTRTMPTKNDLALGTAYRLRTRLKEAKPAYID
jgi:hypothetical protein